MNRMAKKQVYFSFDKETKKLVEKLGYIPEGCYCSPANVFIPEHAEKNKQIILRESKKHSGKR